MKSDWMQYIRPWYNKIVITTCKVKPPGKQWNPVLSDFVKLALEMRGIIDVEDAKVFGILVEGNT